MTTLYRFYDDDNQLLYVGITDRGPGRWRAHMKDKPWWGDVAAISLEHMPDRESALEAESRAIASELPIYNSLKHPLQDGWSGDPVDVYMAPGQSTPDALQRLNSIIDAHGGSTPIILHVSGARRWVCQRTVSDGPEFREEMRMAFGPYIFRRPAPSSDSRHVRCIPLSAFSTCEAGDLVTARGVLRTTGKQFGVGGDTFMVGTLSDLSGSIAVVFPPGLYRVAHQELVRDSMVMLRGELVSHKGADLLVVDRVINTDETDGDQIFESLQEGGSSVLEAIAISRLGRGFVDAIKAHPFVEVDTDDMGRPVLARLPA